MPNLDWTVFVTLLKLLANPSRGFMELSIASRYSASMPPPNFFALACLLTADLPRSPSMMVSDERDDHAGCAGDKAA